MPATPVANYLARCVDLSTDYAYTIEGVPPNSEEGYLVVAFLDVNKNVDPSDPGSAGPDGCDMIALGADVTVTEAGQMVEADEITLGPGGSLLMALGCAACGE
jgi:hypothetical protein